MQLDLIVVADRQCPTSRAYLSYLARAGHRVKAVLLVDFYYGDRRYVSLRRWFGAWIGRAAARRFAPPAAAAADDEFRRVSDSIQQVFSQPVDFFGSFDFGAIADAVWETSATDYNDPALQALLLKEPGNTYLYTNGGRVPASLLKHPTLRILHIHPGVVPHIRGSDGLFWSILMRGCPGASCFFMDAGIDTGALLATREFPLPRFSGLAGYLDRPELLTAAILHSYDPHLRAMLLLDAIAQHGPRLGAAQARPQSETEGMAYSWMDGRLKRRVLQRLVA